jgi:hypothetical protein
MAQSNATIDADAYEVRDYYRELLDLGLSKEQIRREYQPLSPEIDIETINTSKPFTKVR